MNSIFKALSAVERKEQQTAYLAYLKQRDGIPDVQRGTLSKRDGFFNEIDATPLQYQGDLPTEEFQTLLNHPSKGGLSKKAVWMALTARTNEGESYGVKLALSYRRKRAVDLEDHMSYIEIEELYHTRILVDALKVLGVDYRISEPSGPLRWFLNALVHFPKPVSSVLILMGEIAGVLIFSGLRDQARRLFQDDPAALKRIDALLEEILVDEVGHMAFARSQMGAFQLWMVRNAFRVVGKQFMTMNPAMNELFDVDDLVRRAVNMTWDEIPEDVRNRAFIPSDAGFAGRGVARAA